MGRSQNSTFRYLRNRSKRKGFTELQQTELCGNFYNYEIRAFLERKIRQKVFFEDGEILAARTMVT
jgi:hypothetical protein